MPLPLSQLTVGTEDAVLTSDERNYIREVLGVSRVENDKRYLESQIRFELFTAYDNRSARYWIGKYEIESEDEDTMQIDAEGADISSVRTRQRIALALYNLVFAKDNITPLDDINVSQYEEKQKRVKFVPITFGNETPRTSEY